MLNVTQSMHIKFILIKIIYIRISIRNAKIIGMAYGLLANVPPVLGIYTSIFPVLIYSILGPSSHVSKGRNVTNINAVLISFIKISPTAQKFDDNLKYH